jgi:hypothetical protein
MMYNNNHINQFNIIHNKSFNPLKNTFLRDYYSNGEFDFCCCYNKTEKEVEVARTICPSQALRGLDLVY